MDDADGPASGRISPSHTVTRPRSLSMEHMREVDVDADVAVACPVGETAGEGH